MFKKIVISGGIHDIPPFEIQWNDPGNKKYIVLSQGQIDRVLKTMCCNDIDCNCHKDFSTWFIVLREKEYPKPDLVLSTTYYKKISGSLIFEIVGNKMTVSHIPSFPINENPFNYDLYNMGTPVGNNLMVMYDKHPSEKVDYVIIVNILTGERIKINI